NLHRRTEGKRASGSRWRRFGYQRDDVKLHRQEAPLVRAAVKRLLAGVSLHAIALEWNAKGIVASGGGRWRPNSLRRYLESPHLAGWCSFAGQPVLGDDGKRIRGRQQILIDPQDWETLIRRFAVGKTNPGQSKRSRLLSGFLFCG